jgi:hypothetical protein
MWEAGRLACVEDFDSDLMRARGFHLDLLDLEGFAWTPAHGGLALDHLSRSFGHDLGITRATLFDSRRVWDLAVQQHLRKAVAPLHTSFFSPSRARQHPLSHRLPKSISFPFPLVRTT